MGAKVRVPCPCGVSRLVRRAVAQNLLSFRMKHCIPSVSCCHVRFQNIFKMLLLLRPGALQDGTVHQLR